MQIYEFLKVKKVRCVNANGLSLTKDKEYQLLGVTDRSCMINDDDGYETWASMQRFEPVPNDNVTSIFNVGDKVYLGAVYDIKTISKVGNDNDLEFVGELGWVSGYSCCHATQENYEMLCKLYPHIEFELPPKEITGSDLCCLMLRNNHTNIMCQVDGDETNIRIITLYTGSYFYDRSGNRYSEVVPIDTKGNPLTEDVLNDIN